MKMNPSQKLSRRALDLKNEAAQGIKYTAKSQTVFASKKISVFFICLFIWKLFSKQNKG